IATGTSFATDYPALLDLYPDPRTRLFLNTPGAFPFNDVSEDLDEGVELSFAAAYGDANRDGALEVAVHRVGPTARLLHGQPGQGEWLQVLLDGNSPNTKGVGSVVTAWTNGSPDMRQVHCGTQFLSQNSLVLHFGLGDETQCDSVVVNWPDGGQNVFPELPSGTRAILSQSGNLILQGCTYPGACNYNSQVNQEDGTCDFACLCSTGTVWDPVQEECIASCTGDLTGDGQIDVGDLIEFLTMFGLSCP
ncbi:MAG: ASPIC/UnbV domain-containing protein, partial [Bacteroidetes bacterium]|nr:ASPIC/UnbV domain-containing protein [Bacteroidota bacterium]